VRIVAALLLLVPLAVLAEDVTVGDLPHEARRTLALVKGNAALPFPQDGRTFANREGRLPPRARGYYREYTVETPGLKGRGPRRIVAGRGGEFFYTADHYRSFRRIREDPRTSRIRE